MRLINTRTLQLEQFFEDRIPGYAILSHTWEEESEVTFQDWQDIGKASKKFGFVKIQGACRQAIKDGLNYLWVDTNCIDKSSSADLTEAINSMFAWYRDAAVCYAYLVDVPTLDRNDTVPLKHFRKSRWFTRGWTLQELLAPSRVIFYSKDWGIIGAKSTSLANEISEITGIDIPYLTGESLLASASVARKMYWLSKRNTTRVEDMAYCMLGIFDINLPLLYGEGSKAFTRLQEEIIKVSNDHTIFCWTWTASVPQGWVSLLAPSPETFKFSGDFVKANRVRAGSTYSMTNAGLSIRLPMIQSWSYYFVVLNAQCPGHRPEQNACIPVSSFVDVNKVVQRLQFPTEVSVLSVDWAVMEQDIFVRSRPDPLQLRPTTRESSIDYGLLFTLGNTKRLLDSRMSSVSQFDSGGGVFLIENTKGVIGLETYPPGLFDLSRSIFLFNYKIADSVYGGLLRLGSLQAAGVVLFLAITVFPGSVSKWFCRILPSTIWGTNEIERRFLLKYLGNEIAPSISSQRCYIHEGLRAYLIIVDEIELAHRETIRVAHFSFDLDQFRTRFSQVQSGNIDEQEPGSDTDSQVPALARRSWKPVVGEGR
jgi:Heterokaryon incompatibility protein (HET)